MNEERSCPCLYLDKPCSEHCTCKNGASSFGCMYCATYGSLEQRKAAAQRIANDLKSVQQYREALEKIVSVNGKQTDAEILTDVIRIAQSALKQNP